MNKNYYDEKLDEIKELLEKKEFNKVYDLINEELKMPYTPEIYEKKFLDIINDIKHEVIGDHTPSKVTREVAIDYLLSEDEQKESIALELLRDHNLRYDKELIKKRIETWPVEKTMLKAYLFELLIEQEINIDIDFNGIKLNSSTSGSILDNESVIETLNEIPKHFEKNPSAMNLALDEFQRFLLMTYPAIPEDGKNFALDISQIVKSMFDEKTELTDLQTRIKNLMAK